MEGVRDAEICWQVIEEDVLVVDGVQFDVVSVEGVIVVQNELSVSKDDSKVGHD